MSSSFDPETVDLAELAEVLRGACGDAVEGEVVGRTRLRDEAARHLQCSQLEAELLVDTLIGRGFVVRREAEGRVAWLIPGR